MPGGGGLERGARQAVAAGKLEIRVPLQSLWGSTHDILAQQRILMVRNIAFRIPLKGNYPTQSNPPTIYPMPMSENHNIRSGNSSIIYTVEYSVEVDNSPASAITPESGRLSPPPYTYGNGPQDPPGVNDNCENYRACVVSRNLGTIGGGGGSLRRQSMSPRLRVAV